MSILFSLFKLCTALYLICIFNPLSVSQDLKFSNSVIFHSQLEKNMVVCDMYAVCLCVGFFFFFHQSVDFQNLSLFWSCPVVNKYRLPVIKVMLLASTKVVVKKLIKAALKIDNCEFKCH